MAQTVKYLPAMRETQLQTLGQEDPLERNGLPTGVFLGFPGGSGGKVSACNAGDPASIPGLGRPPGEENGYPLQYSCLEKYMDRGGWQATVHGVAKSQM